MASAQYPVPPRGPIPIQPVPPAAAQPEVVESPPPPPQREPLTPERLAREIRRLDGLLIAVTLFLAFFLASFAAHNSDVWMHLATGRLIAHGDYRFGGDPFAFTSPDHAYAWVNHAWLPDLIAYGLAQLFGGPETPAGGAALVAAKALLVAALAGLMLLAGRYAHTYWIAAVGVSLAVLVMSPRLLLQPHCFSLLFLALTLYLLQPAPSETTTARAWPRRLLAIPFVFLLWVNTDAWFILGPLTVALFLAGDCLHNLWPPADVGEGRPSWDGVKRLALVLAAGLVACLVNPFHVHAFALPRELWALMSPEKLEGDPQLRSYLFSPFQVGYLTSPALGLNPAGVAYYLLFLLGLASFYVNRQSWVWWRAIVWLVFALLSAAMARTVPFFAVAGGIVTILNFQDAAAHYFGTEPSIEKRWKNWSLWGRVGTLAAGVALLALAWPGWLHGQPEGARTTHRVAWAVDMDPSLRRAAEKLNDLRRRNVLRDSSHAFNFAPDMADYFAWFCPSEKAFFDYRFQIFGDALQAFQELRNALVTRPEGGPFRGTDWQRTFRERYGIDHVLVATSPSNLYLLLPRFWTQADQWTMLYSDGRTSIFGWNDPAAPAGAPSFRSEGVDFPAQAFGPRVPPEDKAPEQAPPPPRPRPVWEAFLQPPPARPLALDEANLYRVYFEYTVQRWEYQTRLGSGAARSAAAVRMLLTWTAAASAGGSVAGSSVGPLGVVSALPHVEDQAQFAGITKEANQPSDAALLLAVRAARRALAENPDDAEAYRTLGEVYRHVWGFQEEKRFAARSPLLRQVRLVQMATAFQNGLSLKPDDPLVHRDLALTYDQMSVETFLSPQAAARSGFVDLEIEHWRKYLDATRAAGPQERRTPEGLPDRKETQEEFQKRIDDLERFVAGQERRLHLKERQDAYEVESRDKPPLEKAGRALQHGLAKEALDVLRGADPSQLGAPGADLLFHLLLWTGQAYEIPDRDERFNDTGSKVLLAVALGDYHAADLHLAESYRQLEQAAVGQLLHLLRNETFDGRIGQLTLPNVLAEVIRSARGPLDRAEWLVVRGLLALEVGDTQAAAGHLRQALELSINPLRLVLAFTPLAAGSPVEAAVFQAGVAAPRAGPPVFATQALAYRYAQLLQQASHAR